MTVKAPGTTQIRISYHGQSTLMHLTFQAPKGSISLDTASYTFAPGAQYTIGATQSDANGKTSTTASSFWNFEDSGFTDGFD